jgi:hypothetical protein
MFEVEVGGGKSETPEDSVSTGGYQHCEELPH